MAVTPLLKAPFRRNNAVTILLLRCSRPQELPQRRGGRWRRGPYRTPVGARRHRIALGRSCRRPRKWLCPREIRPRTRSTSGRGRGATGRPRERCESSPTPARPNKTSTLQDSRPRPALSAVPAGDPNQGCREPGRVVRAGKGSILVHLRTWPCRPTRPGTTSAYDFLESGCPREIMR
jgi:hypothetical protein